MSEFLRRVQALYLVVSRGRERRERVGHTFVQKAVYLAQEGKGVRLGYRFRFHHYGPYSEQLWNDVRLLSSSRLLEIAATPGGMGHDILLGKEAHRFEELAGLGAGLEEAERRSLAEVVDALAPLKARQLEAVAVSLMVARELSRFSGGDKGLVEAVLDLKPHLGREGVEEALRLLAALGVLDPER